MTLRTSDIAYGVIGNIPPSYRSSSLRNYFSQFVESGGFECFHFKHRPESRLEDPKVASGPGSGSAGKEKTRAATAKHREQTTCCVVKLRRAALNRLIKHYGRKHWLDDDGNSLPSLCVVAEVHIKDGDHLLASEGCDSQRRDFTAADLGSLPELHPPSLMPQGNVGTPTKHFLELIRACRLPAKVIKSLGLTFPSQRRNKKYGCVPFDYGCSARGAGSRESTVEEDPADDKEDGNSSHEVFSAAGHRLYDNDLDAAGLPGRFPTAVDASSENIESKYMDARSDSGEDDDTCENWERHEALHDDAGNYERNEERLFEEKIELKWEKGGSGLVFYTDAQVWQKAEGDFDEQTADDWDVDMSVYYEEDGGDMDARDSVAMRREKRLRLGLDDDSCSSRTGAFERHTKGVGRRLLLQSGWREGGRLGKSVPGLAEALECEGQHPKDKKGLGYFGEKVNRYHSNMARLRQAKDGLPIITTKYDNPRDTDPSETLLRRQNPHNLKYRTPYGAASFVRSSASGNESTSGTTH